jgi:hypothetical protein
MSSEFSHGIVGRTELIAAAYPGMQGQEGVQGPSQQVEESTGMYVSLDAFCQSLEADNQQL